MKIKSKVTRLIVLNVKEGKGYASIHLGAKATVEDARLTEQDIKTYLASGAIEVVGAGAGSGDDETPVVLPENPDAENMKILDVKELKLYCKQNGITKYSKLKEDELIALILESLPPQE